MRWIFGKRSFAEIIDGPFFQDLVVRAGIPKRRKVGVSLWSHVRERSTRTPRQWESAACDTLQRNEQMGSRIGAGAR